jgi:hypothetical protein
LNEDFRDFLRALIASGARFLVVGAHALAAYGVARATGDIDLWIPPEEANAELVWQALIEFGAPVEALDISRSDLETPGIVCQIGLPPRRIDLLTELTGVDFEAAWKRRAVRQVDDLELPFIDRQTFVQNKRAAGRPKDLADLALLEESDR